jgi:hypothetical protein
MTGWHRPANQILTVDPDPGETCVHHDHRTGPGEDDITCCPPCGQPAVQVLVLLAGTDASMRVPNCEEHKPPELTPWDLRTVPDLPGE